MNDETNIEYVLQQNCDKHYTNLTYEKRSENEKQERK